MFGLSLHGWENSMVVFLIIAGFFALLAGAATWAVVRLTRIELAESKTDMERYKLTVEGQVADAKKEGVDAGKAAGNALVQAAELEVALEAQRTKTAEALRAADEARLALEQFRAPRTFSPDQIAALTSVAKQYPNTSIDVWVSSSTEDANDIAELFSSTVEKGGNWKPITWVWSGIGPIKGTLVVVKKDAQLSTSAAATALVKALGGDAPTAWPNDWDKYGGMLNGPAFNASRAEMRLLIGSKPQ